MNKTNTQNILEKDISRLFGFSNMSEEEKAELLDDVGSLIIESATLRFIVESDAAEAERFESFVEEHAEEDEMLQNVLKSFPRFEELLQEEIVVFKEEAGNVLAG